MFQLSRVMLYNLGCVPLGWSGSGSVIQDHSDHGAWKEPTIPFSFDARWSEWSRITDPDPELTPGKCKSVNTETSKVIQIEMCSFATGGGGVTLDIVSVNITVVRIALVFRCRIWTRPTEVSCDRVTNPVKYHSKTLARWEWSGFERGTKCRGRRDGSLRSAWKFSGQRGLPPEVVLFNRLVRSDWH